MTTTVTAPTTGIFERNISVIQRRWPHLAAQIVDATPAEDFELVMSPQHVPTARYRGRWMASRHRPLEEATRLADQIDLVDSATVVVSGFGLGYHVQLLSERMRLTGVVICFESDVRLLRRVFELIDHSEWLESANIILVTNASDRGSLGDDLRNLESILLMGTAFLEPPAHRERLAESYTAFLNNFSQHVTACETTLMTTLVRSHDTIRNLLLNIRPYAIGAGIEDLRDAAAGAPAVVVSAGPSLHKTIGHLAQPGVRDRCVIIAVQTALRPLLEAGVKPHYVTALDYHELSRRFYEELDPDDVTDITLIADPKVHPSVVQTWPGPVRVCASPFIDALLGDVARPMGEIRAGATVAHLALYVALHLGCRTIALTGQDLGYPDGLYYAPGTAIHRVWAPELNPFNTIAMMEWERIVRLRQHLHQALDHDGKTIYTDAQMVTYLRHFEADFARYRQDGITIVDATEGGVRKQHVDVQPLASFLDAHATTDLSSLPVPPPDADRRRQRDVIERIDTIRDGVRTIRQNARTAHGLISEIIDRQDDQAFVNKTIDEIAALRNAVSEKTVAFDVLNQFNQLGAYRRLRADRRLSMRADLSPFDRQRAELERDRDNLQWLMDSSEHLDRLLHDAMRILKGEDAGESSYRSRAKDVKKTDGPPRRFIACMPVDTDRTALGWSRALDDSFGESTVLDATLQRVSSSRELDGIALIIRRGAAVLQGIDLKKYAVPVTVIETDDDVFAGAPEAFGQARRWAPQSWRGSIGGTSIYDEYLVADAAMVALNETGGTHAVMVGPEWVFMNVTGDGGLDDLIARERASIAESNITFTQAPPGFGACLVSKRAMSQLTLKTRASTIGAALSYQPSSPTSDPIAFPINMQIEADVRHAMVRGTWDSRRQRERIGRVAQNPNELSTWPTPTLVTALDRDIDTHGDVFPSHLQLEITTRCSCRGRFHEHPFGAIDRPDIEPELARDLFAELAAYDDVVVTLGGVGDPLVHPSCARIVQYAKDAGISSVHLRTALRSDTDTIDAIVEAGADVLSVDLHAITPETYGVMMGTTDIDLVIRNLEYTVAQSRRFTTIPGSAGAALPWIVPRLQRCAETYNDLEAFYDRWKSVLGAAAIDPPPPFEPTSSYATDTLRPAITPADVAWRQLMTRFTVFADGSVPVSELDLAGNTVVGRAGTTPVTTLWSSLINARQEVRRTRGRDDVALRLFRP